MNNVLNQKISGILEVANSILLGKESILKLTLTAVLAGGHLLVEDLPGVGKTTLSHLIGKLLGLEFQRIQFTSDLLPADIIGVSVYQQANAQFVFHQGPLFSQLVLADEINRATPKTQSALLEAMEEQQITVDGQTHQLPQPFFVIATQNPQSHIGTYALPESQLDRFLFCLQIGYPDSRAERELLEGQDRRKMIHELSAITSPAEIIQLQQQVRQIYTSPALLDYCQSIIAYSRNKSVFKEGLSPRASLSLLQAARAWAFIHNRDEVLPDDLQAVIPGVVNHRLNLLDHIESELPSDQILGHVPVN